MTSGPWPGHGGRSYERATDESPREGRISAVLPAIARGMPAGRSVVPEGARVAVRLYLGHDADALSAFLRDTRVKVVLTKQSGTPPCPQIYDEIGTAEVPGVVMEWCPTDIELWWASRRSDPDGFWLLCRAMADVCRQASDTWGVLAKATDIGALVLQIKPRTVMQSSDGRWLLTSFAPAPTLQADAGGGDTVLMTDHENFVSPESLFETRGAPPLASATWAVGCCMFALLRMRTFLVAGAPLPSSGTDSHHFRSHRVNLVADLHARKPNLFRGREIDPRQFLYPERLADQDRRAVTESLVGVFGGDQDALEGQLAREVLKVLDRALMIDPAKRYLEPLEMAADFEVLGRRFREMRAELRAARMGQAPPDEHETQILEIAPSGQVARLAPVPPPVRSAQVIEGVPAPEEPPPAEASPTAVATMPPTAPPSKPPPPSEPPPTPPAEQALAAPSDGAPAPEPPKAAPPTPPETDVDDARIAALESRVRRLSEELREARAGRSRPRTALWVVAAVLMLMFLQVAWFGGLAFIWWQGRVPVEVTATVPPPAVRAPEAVPPPRDAVAEAVLADEEAVDAAAEQPAVGEDALPVEPAEGEVAAVEPPAAAEPPRATTSTTPKTTSTRSSGGSSTSARSRPSEPAPAAEPAVSSTATVAVEGGTAWLVGPGGRQDMGTVPAGNYEFFATPTAGTSTSLGRFDLPGGSRAVVKCGFGMCKVVVR